MEDVEFKMKLLFQHAVRITLLLWLIEPEVKKRERVRGQISPRDPSGFNQSF